VDLSRELIGNTGLDTRLSAITGDRQEVTPAESNSHWQLPEGQLFKRLDFDVLKNKDKTFQYMLGKRDDGRCIFLTEENRCRLHEQFGPQAKPAMCQLFPYTFTEAPDGWYASVSFASSGVLFNDGLPLSDQREILLEKLSLFKNLFPDLKLDWSQIQLFDGSPMRWSSYLLYERKMLELIESESHQKASGKSFSWQELLTAISEFLLSKVSSEADLERASMAPPMPETDLLVIRYLLDVYFPTDVFSLEETMPLAEALINDLAKTPEKIEISVNSQLEPLQAICSMPLPRLDSQTESLLARYLYSRIYSKLYFGPGMAHFSLISGFHHLGVVHALIRIQLKRILRARALRNQQSPVVGIVDVAEIVRTLERRLSSSPLTAESANILQVLLESPSRFRRLLRLGT
jgi:Fe-S-cluster containining protein